MKGRASITQGLRWFSGANKSAIVGLFFSALLMISCGAAGGTWQPLVNQLGVVSSGNEGNNKGAIAPLLLTDGTILVQNFQTGEMWKLVPDKRGDYVNGTWIQVASLP